MSNNVVVKKAVNCLFHTPRLVLSGSKPMREIQKGEISLPQIGFKLRSYKMATVYPPNQTFIGNISPEELLDIPQPWHQQDNLSAKRCGRFGRIMDETTFLSLLALSDIGGFFEISDDAIGLLSEKLKTCPFFKNSVLDKVKVECYPEIFEKIMKDNSVLAIVGGKKLIGCFNRDNSSEGGEDENLKAHHLLENYCAKASGAFAIKELCYRSKIKPEKIDFILSCGEEACGDRYQRGGGGMAKAMGEMAGCLNAGGMDVKNFCAAPVSAIITASAFVKSCLYDNVVVVGGGSLAKLGMKFKSFLQQDMPILDDCLGAFACLITRDDGISPIIRLEKGATGLNPISAGFNDGVVYNNVIIEPLKVLGLKMSDVDKYAPELQDPEIMQFAGSGDVATANYKKIALMAIKSGEIEMKDAPEFIKKIGMPGFSPVQGHIPSAVPYLAHAVENIMSGKMNRAMFVGKASLFLNRLVKMFDAKSFIIEKNPSQGGTK